LRNRPPTYSMHARAYCQSVLTIVGMPFEVDHVIPESLGGQTLRERC